MLEVRASAPGSLMLFGEHAVLRGQPALVCAIRRRLSVTARLRSDRRAVIHSILGDLRFEARRIPEDHRHRFVLEALRASGLPPGGLDLRIESEFSSKIGFGSSAAVTIAVLAALDALKGRPARPGDLFRRARAVVRSVQGVGSGADVAASAWGGALLFRQAGVRPTRLPVTFPLIAAYSGHKTPTPDVIRQVNALAARHPRLSAGIFRLMGRCTLDAAAALRQGDLARVGDLMNLHQGLHDALGVNTQGLACLAFALRADPGIFGSKISGSGMGDCVIGLGRLRHRGPGALSLEIAVDPEGVRLEPVASPSSPRATRSRRKAPS
jgi:mevalonate kinase